MIMLLAKCRSMCTLVHAVARFAQSTPLGNIAIGLRRVSWVVLIEALTSHRIGPSPITSSSASNVAWMSCSATRTDGVRRSASETIPRGGWSSARRRARRTDHRAGCRGAGSTATGCGPAGTTGRMLVGVLMRCSRIG